MTTDEVLERENFSLARRLCARVVALEWVWLALLLPAALLTTTGGALVLLIIPGLWLARKVATGRFVPPTPLDGLLAGFLFMLFVSLTITFDLTYTLPKVIGLVYGVAVFYAVAAGAGRSDRNLWFAFGLFLAGGLGVAVIGFLGLGISFNKLPVLGRVYELLPTRLVTLPGAESGIHPNQVAGALLWVVPSALVVALALLARVEEVKRKLAGWQWPAAIVATWSVALLLAALLVLTQSRSGLLGLVLAGAFLFLTILLRNRWLM
ncbi:MAG: hypothetical protein L0322_12550, partial [Chloroflexi bacterium]|nr:hypothetical protein [Chloroflexota bacterium]